MFIIWGFRNTEKVLGHTHMAYQCSNCHNVSNYKVFRRISWFTLFWIPLIPFSFSHYVTCPICNYGIKTKKQNALELMNQNPN